MMQLLKNKFVQKKLNGRYITNQHIEPYLNALSCVFTLDVLGLSVNGQNIYRLRAGSGKQKILMWSQMHGNESTTTKALIDFMFFLKSKEPLAQEFLRCFSFELLPILNPDGAKKYTRVNANGLDLNRDAFNCTEPESQLLRETYLNFQPDFSFNLHDQRTIFSAGNKKKSATISFLAPSYNEQRSLNQTRETVMKVASKIVENYSEDILAQISRFDDGFNINCIGDYLMYQNFPVLLIEAGHFAKDYQREQTRELVFEALIWALKTLKNNSLQSLLFDSYLNLAENQKQYCDVLIKTATETFAFQYKEVLKEAEIYFKLEPLEAETSQAVFGHQEIYLSDFSLPKTDLKIELKKQGFQFKSNGLLDF